MHAVASCCLLSSCLSRPSFIASQPCRPACIARCFRGSLGRVGSQRSMYVPVCGPLPDLAQLQARHYGASHREMLRKHPYPLRSQSLFLFMDIWQEFKLWTPTINDKKVFLPQANCGFTRFSFVWPQIGPAYSLFPFLLSLCDSGLYLNTWEAQTFIITLPTPRGLNLCRSLVCNGSSVSCSPSALNTQRQRLGPRTVST